MLSAIALPFVDSSPDWRNRPDAQWVQLDQPLPKQAATQRHQAFQQAAHTTSAWSDQTRICAHWPLLGVDHIRSASRLLRGQAESLAQRGQFDGPATQDPRCLDLAIPLYARADDGAMQRLAALWARVQTQKLALARLAEDFSTLSTWLASEAEFIGNAAKTMRQKSELTVAIGEGQRLLSKDSFCADVNAMIAALLRRAVKMLDRLDPATGNVNTDTTGRRACSMTLLQTAELLDNAATLAADAALYVTELDRQWRLIRRQVAHVMASTRSAAPPSEPAL